MRKGLWRVGFVDFVSVSLELLQCNLKLNNMHSLSFVKVEIKMITSIVKNSLKTLSYHFDFYVGEKYMECLLVDFSDYNQWSIGWGNPIISDDRLWNLNRFPPLVSSNLKKPLFVLSHNTFQFEVGISIAWHTKNS